MEISLYEKRFNELRSTFDLRRKYLIDSVIILEVISENSKEPISKELAEKVLPSLRQAIDDIGAKCGYAKETKQN